MAASLTAKTKMAGATAGAEVLARMMPLEEIEEMKEFKELFPIHQETLDQVVARMKKYGYDKSQPLHVWKREGRFFLMDGYTRREGAATCGFTEVPVYVHEFPSLEDAMEYTIGLQTARRNLNDAELSNAILRLDALKSRGRKTLPGEKKDPEAQEEKGKSALHLAKVLGTSTTKIEKFRAVEKKATPEVKTAVASGALSINQAYETTKLDAAHCREADTGKTLTVSLKLMKTNASDLFKWFLDKGEYLAVASLIEFFKFKQCDIDRAFVEFPDQRDELMDLWSKASVSLALDDIAMIVRSEKE